MNNSVKLMLLAAAGTGLMSGTTTIQPTTVPLKNAQSISAGSLGQMPLTFADGAKHDCKGMNSCKGQGGCATSDMGCKGKNSCQGKGGCKTNM